MSRLEDVAAKLASGEDPPVQLPLILKLELFSSPEKLLIVYFPSRTARVPFRRRIAASALGAARFTSRRKKLGEESVTSASPFFRLCTCPLTVSGESP